MKKKTKKEHLKKIARAHTIFLVIAFGLYVILAAIFSPEFIFSDLRHKFSALADGTIAITAKVLGPPVQPIVSGSAFCNSGNLGVSLSWPADENSETFDIDRDGAPLITGLTNHNYTDSAVVIDTIYTYTVTARGSMGPGLAVSDPVIFSTPTECNVPKPPPTVEIDTLNYKNISSYGNPAQITERQPSFSGTTNIPYAKIILLLESGPIVSATTYANENGYWSWTDPETLDIGSHSLHVTAVDPNDESTTVSDDFYFEVTAIEEESTGKNSSEQKKSPQKNVYVYF